MSTPRSSAPCVAIRRKRTRSRRPVRAAGYAFDKDCPRDLAWSLVARTARNVAAFTRKMGAGVKDPEAKNALTMAAGIHRDLLAEANEERARLEGAAP